MIDKKNKNFYITTTLPYTNGKPHIGFAMEIIRADVLARHKRILLGDDNVFFNTGSDEHGQKLYEGAKKENLSTQDYVDKMSANFQKLLKPLNISHDKFIRTTDEEHKKAAQKFWNICKDKNLIYKKNYKGKYCVGCELGKQESELENGKCPIHPDKEIEISEEENYFFAWSKFEKTLLEYFKKNPIVPNFRQKEIENFVHAGLEDFSISRLKEKMPWGVKVPGDKNHVMYVWFDALVNYISTLGWASDNEENFEKFWGYQKDEKQNEIFQICGKDNLRQQSAMWQAMLSACDIKNTDKIFINGFINVDGQKMSKSLGNVIDPLEIVEKYGTDALRYYVCRHFNNFEDSDFTFEKFNESYNANLVNGLGNLTNRILAMSSNAGVKLNDEDGVYPVFGREYSKLEDYDFNNELDEIWKSIGDLDELITRTAPFKLAKSDESKDKKKLKVVLLSLLNGLWAVADWVYPVMPETSKKIKKAIVENKKPEEPIFPRMEK